MTNSTTVAANALAEIDLPEFARAFALRAPRLSLFLGAGASVSSGIPTAAQLVREFKREIFATETGVHPSRVASMVDPIVEETIQRHFDSRSNFPRPGEANEYSFYFERAYADSNDRRLFIARKTDGRRPGYGYLCLGSLLSAGKCRFVWTPNFDDLVDQCFSVIADGRAVSVVGRDTLSRFDTYLRDERFPIVVKVHGDFRVDSLQNTSQELVAYDAELRDAFVENCRSYGLVVVGYSGRDASVMSALHQALASHGTRAFPDGLYWCLRHEDRCPDSVAHLLQSASQLGVRASIVRIPDFDDFAASLYRACGLQNALVDAKLAERQRVRRGYELAVRGQVEPVLKLNAIPIASFPDRCYRLKADVRGWKDLRSLVEGCAIAAALHRGRVLALGRRSDIETAFRDRGLSDLQLSAIAPDMDRPDSVVVGLFYDAIARALSVQGSPLQSAVPGRASRVLFLRQENGLPSSLNADFKDLALRDSTVAVRKTRGGYWVHEAVRLSLDFRDGKLWLLFEPTVFLTTDGILTPWDSDGKSETIRELLAQRYNRHLSGLMTYWLKVLNCCLSDDVLRFPVAEDGFEFRFERTLAISYQQP